MKTGTCITGMLLILVGCGAIAAEGAAGSAGELEPRHLVNTPTAGMIRKGSYALDMDFYQGGGMVLGVSAGLLDRLSIGISYGGSRIIGSEKPVMNKAPGAQVRIRLIEESFSLPAIALGFDSQGKDGFHRDRNRYTVKSPGFYAVASKNYSLAGYFSIHGGVNYSLERADDRDVNFFAGVEKTIGPVVSAVLEYDVAFNDSDTGALGRGRGYLNASLKWAVGGGLTLSINLKDLLKNAQRESLANRTIKIEFSRAF